MVDIRPINIEYVTTTKPFWFVLLFQSSVKKHRNNRRLYTTSISIWLFIEEFQITNQSGIRMALPLPYSNQVGEIPPPPGLPPPMTYGLC